jgi:hypothetical protein
MSKADVCQGKANVPGSEAFAVAVAVAIRERPQMHLCGEFVDRTIDIDGRQSGSATRSYEYARALQF